MTKPSRTPILRALAPSILTLALGVGAAGCGFQPLYGPSVAGPQGAGLAGVGPVKVNTISGRTGFFLKAELDRLLSAGVPKDEPISQLTIELSEQIAGIGLRVNETATRADLTLTAKFALKDPDGKLLERGEVRNTVSYNLDGVDRDASGNIRSDGGPFSDVAATQDARERAALLLAETLRLELALRAKARAAKSQKP